MNILIALFFSLFTTIETRAAVADLHSHLAAHLPYGFMLKGGTPEEPAPDASTMTHEHKFHQHPYRDWIRRSGVQLHVMAALPNIFVMSREQARQQVDQQLQFVEDFAQRNAQDFVLAKTPEEALAGISAGKVVLVHAIEGGEYLLDTPEDAHYWAKRGVAMIGPIHLIDIGYGDSCIMHGRKLLNWKGSIRRGLFGGVDRGLSPTGIKALEHMRDAGIIVDLAHMSPKSVADSLAFGKNHQLPMVLSHGYFRAHRDEERGINEATLKELTAQGGLFGLTLGGFALYPLDAKAQEGCPLGSVADFARHSEYARSIMPPDFVMAIGSDANGFVDHLAPCAGGGQEPVWQTGIRTPIDFGPLVQTVSAPLWQQSAERFIEIWQKARALAKP